MWYWRHPSGALEGDPHGIWVALISQVLIVEVPENVKANVAVSVVPELPISMYTVIIKNKRKF